MLSLSEVEAGYGRTPVLHGLSLEAGDGEIVAMLGRNGVGKTTMLRAVVGEIPLRGGSVRLDGEELGGLRAHRRARRGLAYVPQGRDVFPALSVADNLRVAAFGARLPNWRERVDALLDEFPILREKAGERGAALSGGQQQILAVARALVGEPRVLLLDEPSEGVQPSIVDQIGEIIRDVNERRGLTVVLVEQNLDFAAELAARAYLMDKGRVVRELPPSEVLADADLQREYMGV